MTDAGDQERPLDIRVGRGAPTDEELAALFAVLSEAYATEAANAVAPPPSRRSAWDLSARGLRRPLERERGWGGFSG